MLCSKAQTVVFPENADTLLHPNRHQRTLLKSVILSKGYAAFLKCHPERSEGSVVLRC